MTTLSHGNKEQQPQEYHRGAEINKKAVFLCTHGDMESFTVKTKSCTQIISDTAQIKRLHTLWKTQSFPLITAAC